MDSLITAAVQALATGDPLSALKRIALRDDAPALALRGIAMAQLGDLARAKELLRPCAPDTGVSGLESDGGERFFCGGGRTGKIRAIRRPRRKS